MDVNKLLRTVHNLDDYISATQVVINKHKNSKIQFNMSTVLSLKKIRSLEIEYFNKCDESGAGIKILELMLRLPPSKTWSLLGKELVILMQYWLEAIRQHLIRHNNHWWNFLSILLKFIQEIRSKHTALSNILVQELSECLLDLATNSQPTVVQRFKILQCYNSVCAESAREIRYALRNKFGNYFVKLSSILSSCGDMRAQYSIMETLLRWLLPRQDIAVKHEAAAKWFPHNLYNNKAREIFIERSWQNFFKDARDFLNAHNMSSDLVTSVVCKRFCIGNVTLISGSDRDYYLDINTSTAMISLMIEPGLSDVLGASVSNAVVISKENTDTIRMYRESSQVFVSMNIMDPQLLYPSTVLEGKDIQIVVSSRSDLVKLDRALRCIFDNKYELLMDLENPPPTSPTGGELRGDCNMSVSNEGTRFSHPVELSKSKRSGFIVRPKPPSSWKSPSTASTSSLALLREKLSALPGYKFSKEPVSVCLAPQLSVVSEVSEDERPSTRRGCSIRRRHKCMTPADGDDNPISCLLVATVGSSDSVINDTLERLPKDKELHTDNIVELLAREALRSTDPKFTHREVSGDVGEDARRLPPLIDGVTLVSTSAADVSIADVVEDSQFVNARRGIKSVSSPLKEKPAIPLLEKEPTTYDIRAVEDFFSQHCSQNENGDLLISPTLAKKINETSSESSLDLDIRTPVNVDIESNQCDDHFNLGNVEIVECLNNMVNKVCEDLGPDLEKYTQDLKHLNALDKVKEFRSKTPLNEIQDIAKTTNKKHKKNTRLKLQYKNTRSVKSRVKNQKKSTTENSKRMSTIVEKDSDVEKTILNKSNLSPESNSQRLNDYETPLIRRKRKLYSPKDDNAVNEKTGIHISETEDDHSNLTGTRIVDKTPKTLATSYKDIEKIRRISARSLLNRKSGINLSPRTKKNNDIFDNLKKTVEGEEKIILADKKMNSRNKKLAVYNFSSDSEDDHFEKKNCSKKYTSTVGSVESAKSTRPRKTKGRNITSEEKKNKNVKRRKSKSDLKEQILESRNEMIDERIRKAAAEALNTSLVFEQQNDLTPKALEPVIREKPQMEIIEDEKDLHTRRTTRRKKTPNLSLKKEKICHKDKNVCSDKEQSVRSSPLPGLIIETVQVQIHKDPDDSITVAMLEKYKDIYNNEPLPDISEINTTHNLLSDLEQITYDSILNITEEYKPTNTSAPLGKRLRTVETDNSPKAKKSKLSTCNASEDNGPQIIHLSDVSDAKSDKSIATLGKSPITGHGDFEESPPNTNQLKQRYEPRGLETQDFNQSMKDYFNKLTNDIYEVSKTSHSQLILDKKSKAKESEESPMKLITKQTAVNMSPTISIKRLSPREIGRWLPPRFNSIFGSNQSSEYDHAVHITRSHTRSQGKLPKNVPNSIHTKSSKISYRKSAISPIKMFGEISKEKSHTSDNNDYLERIKKIMTTKRAISKAATTKSNSSRYELRKCSSKTENLGKTSNSKHSTDVTEYSNKIKQSSPVVEVTEKEETGTVISDFESEQGSNINEWFNRNEVQKRGPASNDLSLKDNMENIMEKLETTLTEIHYKTSKKFVSMFVDAHQHLTDLRQRRRQLYKQTAKEVMSDIVKVMDTKFDELDRRSQDLDQQFIAGLKKNASDVIRADCTQKRDMVSLLKEDVQTVLNHINKGGNTNL